MDWQQAVSLGIVIITVFLFVWRRLGRSRFSSGREARCGCAGIQSTAPAPSIVYRRQRGGPTEILIRPK